MWAVFSGILTLSKIFLGFDLEINTRSQDDGNIIGSSVGEGIRAQTSLMGVVSVETQTWYLFNITLYHSDALNV